MGGLGDPRREEIDPEGRYRVTGLMQVERRALELIPLLGSGYYWERTRDLFLFMAIDPEAPDVIVTAEALELRLPAIEWPHPNIPAFTSRPWKRLGWDEFDAAELPRLLGEARRARLDEYRPCAFCGRVMAPERLTGGACDPCALTHLGIIH